MVGYRDGTIRMFKNPAVVTPLQENREYKMHGVTVNRLRFSCDDNYLLSISGADRSLLVWKVEWDE